MTQHGRPKRYRPPSEHRRVTIKQISAEIDRTVYQTEKLMKKVAMIGFGARRSKDGITTYDAEALEVLKAMLGIPHRPIQPEEDWLGKHLGGEPH